MKFLVPYEPANYWQKIALYGLYGVVFFMPLHPILGDISLLVSLVATAINGQVKWSVFTSKKWWQWSWIGFGIWSLLSTLAAPHPWMSQFNWLYNVGAYGSIFFLMGHYGRIGEVRKNVLRLFFLSATCVCLVGIYQYIHSVASQMQLWVDASQFPKLKRRMYATLFNPNLLGEYLLLVLSVSGTLLVWLNKKKRWSKVWSLMLVSFICLLCLILTYSRGSWISLALMVAYWGIMLDKRLLWFLLAIPGVLFFYHGEVASRLWSLFDRQDTSVALRWALWDSTTYMIKENPMFGIGWNAFLDVYPEYNYFIQEGKIQIYHAHNMFLNILAEVGIPGALFYFSSMYGLVIEAFSARKKVNGYQAVMCYAFGAVVLSVTVSGFFDHNLYSHQVSVVFWQIAGLMASVIYPLGGVKDEEQS